MPRRVPLGPELKRRFQHQGRPMIRVAEALGFSVNSLRSWIRRNVFPSDELGRLANAAGLPANVERLRNAYVFEIARSKKTYGRKLTEILDDPQPEPGKIVDAIQSHWDAFHKDSPSAAVELQALFRMLLSDSFYVCAFSDRVPYEWTGVGWNALSSEISRAVAAGAVMVYLHLSENRVQGLPSMPSDINGVFETFRARVAASAREGASGKVIQLSCENGAYFVPGQHYRLYKVSAEPSAFHLYLQIWQGVSAADSAVIPLAEDAAEHFLNMAQHALQREHPELAAALVGV